MKKLLSEKAYSKKSSLASDRLCIYSHTWIRMIISLAPLFFVSVFLGSCPFLYRTFAFGGAMVFGIVIQVVFAKRMGRGREEERRRRERPHWAIQCLCSFLIFSPILLAIGVGSRVSSSVLYVYGFGLFFSVGIALVLWRFRISGSRVCRDSLPQERSNDNVGGNGSNDEEIEQ